MNRPDWSLGAWGLTLVAVAAVALLVTGALTVSGELRGPLERITRKCERRAPHIADPNRHDEFVSACEEREKRFLDLPPN